MGEFLQEEVSESLLLICMYCHKHRNDAGYWEQVYGFSESFPDERKSLGMCPECLKEHFPDEYVSLCEEGKIVVKEKVMPNNRVLYGSFLIVNHMGYLHGGYDREQRL